MERPPIEEMEARVRVAAKGPYHIGESAKHLSIRYISGEASIPLAHTIDLKQGEALHVSNGPKSRHNAEFFAHAITDIPQLIAYIKHLESPK